MGGEQQVLLGWLKLGLGALLIVLVLLDVFLTVLYARLGTGVFSNQIARFTWLFFKWISRPFGRRRGVILSYCGPVILVLYIFFWGLLLAIGAAFIIQPALGAAIQSGSGDTPTDFLTALFVGGSSMSIIGAGDFSPVTGPYRLFFLFMSIIGISITTLTISYLMQVYSALHRRNTIGLKFHLLTAETGDAAELIAGLGPEGKFDGYGSFKELAADITQAKESHHFYPILFFFRFRESYYSVSRFTLVALDTVTLVKSALEDKKYAWLKESAFLLQLWRASTLLVTSVEETYLPGGIPDRNQPPDEPTRACWRRRYQAALSRLRQAGIPTIADEQAGLETYIRLRCRWDAYITQLAPAMVHPLAEIDPAVHNPDNAGNRTEFKSRLHAIGTE
jgi:hypothetical protein